MVQMARRCNLVSGGGGLFLFLSQSAPLLLQLICYSQSLLVASACCSWRASSLALLLLLALACSLSVLSSVWLVAHHIHQVSRWSAAANDKPRPMADQRADGHKCTSDECDVPICEQQPGEPPPSRRPWPRRADMTCTCGAHVLSRHHLRERLTKREPY